MFDAKEREKISNNKGTMQFIKSVEKICVKTFSITIILDESKDPSDVPMAWVSKWVDYSDKYGFGYQLISDDAIGVIFNDLTKRLLLVDGKCVR